MAEWTCRPARSAGGILLSEGQVQRTPTCTAHTPPGGHLEGPLGLVTSLEGQVKDTIDSCSPGSSELTLYHALVGASVCLPLEHFALGCLSGDLVCHLPWMAPWIIPTCGNLCFHCFCCAWSRLCRVHPVRSRELRLLSISCALCPHSSSQCTEITSSLGSKKVRQGLTGASLCLLAHQGAALLPGRAEGPEEGKARSSSRAVLHSCWAGCPLVSGALVTDTAEWPVL